jgi:NADH:ubiquinone reductase (H+-translocating)
MTREADPAGSPAPLHVVVVGAGFAGVSCAQALADAGIRVTLLDRHNYHQFQPLLYQVATAQLAPDDVATPLRSLFRKEHDVAVTVADVTAVDPATRTVTTADGTTYTGDYLVLAVGSRPNFFRTPGAAEHTMPLYSLRDAERLRSRLIEVCDAADRDPDLIAKGALTFVVVGGGATGVEIAGALSDFLDHVVPQEYHDLAVQETRVHLVDHGTALLAPFSEDAHKYAAKVLEKGGVRLHMGTGVEEVTVGSVRLADGTVLPTRCVVWAGGLQAAELAAGTGLPQVRGGRLPVGDDLSVEGHPHVFVLGDVASLAGPDGVVYPQLGSVALQQGMWAAKNILAEQAGEPRRAFHYKDKGTMAMIGRGAAVAEFGKKRHELHGAVAFASWLGVHAWLMSGIRSRVDAFVSWGWDYFSGNRTPGLLDHPTEATVDWSDPPGIPAPRAQAEDAVRTG